MMKEKLVEFFVLRVKFMDFMETPKARHIYLDQCFGALSFALDLDKENEATYTALWDEWKPILEAKVWGC